jgi:hypothetical protein
MGYSGAGEKLSHEKNQMQKSRDKSQFHELDIIYKVSPMSSVPPVCALMYKIFGMAYHFAICKYKRYSCFSEVITSSGYHVEMFNDDISGCFLLGYFLHGQVPV